MEVTMRRGRIFFYLAVILILAIFAVFVLIRMNIIGGPTLGTNTGPAPTPTQIETVKVVVINQPVKRQQIMESAMLKEVDYPRNLTFEGIVTNLDDAIGKTAAVDLEPGTILTQSMVEKNVISIPRGLVAISIPISRLSSVSFAPQRGDHVNVIVTLLFLDVDTDFQTRLPNSSAGVLGSGQSVLIGPGQKVTDQAGSLNANEQIKTLGAQVVSGSTSSPMGKSAADPLFGENFYQVPSESQRPRLVSQTLIQNVIVLQMGNFNQPQLVSPQPTAQAQPGQTNPEQPTQVQTTNQEAQPLPDVITLIVSPQDAVTLNYLIYAGAKLTLALRSANDDSTTTTEAVTLQFLLESYNIPIPVKLPYGIEPRVDDLNLPTLPNDKPTPTPQP
jgi:Flp pilus assembly protein CpaB